MPCFIVLQAVSCDEAFLNVSGQGDPNEIARTIRGQIYEATGCTASCGVAGNMLLARLATKKAKPNGQYHIPPDQVLSKIDPVGWLCSWFAAGMGNSGPRISSNALKISNVFWN